MLLNYVDTVNIIHFMHDKYAYEVSQFASKLRARSFMIQTYQRIAVKTNLKMVWNFETWGLWK